MCEEKLEDVEAEEVRGVSPARRRHRTDASTTNRYGRGRATTDEPRGHPKRKLTELPGKGKTPNRQNLSAASPDPLRSPAVATRPWWAASRRNTPRRTGSAPRRK